MSSTPHSDRDTVSLDSTAKADQPPPRTRKEALMRMNTKHLLSYLDIYATIPEHYITLARDILKDVDALKQTIILATGIEAKAGDPLQERGDAIIASLEFLNASAQELQKQATFIARTAGQKRGSIAKDPPKNWISSVGELQGTTIDYEQYHSSCLSIIATLKEQFRQAEKTILSHESPFPAETRTALAEFMTTCESRLRQIDTVSTTLHEKENTYRSTRAEERAAFDEGRQPSFVERLLTPKALTGEEKARFDAITQTYRETALQLAAQAGTIGTVIDDFKARTEHKGDSPEEALFLEARRPSFLAALEKLSKATTIFQSTVAEMEHHLSTSFNYRGPHDKQLALGAFHNAYHAKKEEISHQFTAAANAFGYLRDDAPPGYFAAYSGFVDRLSENLDALDRTFGDMTRALEAIPPANQHHSR